MASEMFISHMETLYSNWCGR